MNTGLGISVGLPAVPSGVFTQVSLAGYSECQDHSE